MQMNAMNPTDRDVNHSGQDHQSAWSMTVSPLEYKADRRQSARSTSFALPASTCRQSATSQAVDFSCRDQSINPLLLR
jgi:hypothetical protein